MEWLIRFVAGGLIISLFALLGDVLRPKGFAGLFGAAPSVALATSLLTVFTKGAQVVSLEGRSMMLGAAAFVFYGVTCVYLMAIKRVPAAVSAVGALFAWALVAWMLWATFLR